MTQPKISIITPAYNAEAYLAATIDSVLSQSFGDFEWVIVNDGSSDRTGELLSEIQDQRVRVLSQENRGVSAARNTALDVHVGKCVTFLDADDVLPERSLEVRVNYLDETPQVGIVDGVLSYRDISLANERKRHEPNPTVEPIFPRLVALDERFFAGTPYMLRSECIGEIRFDRALTNCEDLLFFLEIASKNDLIYGSVKEEVYHYRTGHGSAMSNLEGLEHGYLAFLSALANLYDVSDAQLDAARARVSRIMTRSWLRRGRPLRSLVAARRVQMATLKS